LLVVIPSRILDHGYLTYVSGAWAALADDVAHGVLYRPLVSDIGYGGTRYFPLHFVIHGALHSLGLSLIASGHLISLLSAAGVVIGGAVGLRRQGVPWTIAWVTGVLALASRTAFIAIAGIRGDILPVALGVLGLALLPRSKSESMLPSTALLALAVLAKPTLAWAPAAAVLSIAVASRFREAVLLGVWTGIGIAIGLGVTYVWSGGEVLVSFGAFATAGGLSPHNIAALRFLRPGEVTWILCAGLVAVPCGWRALAQPFSAAFPVCLLATLVLYLSPGLHVNHFIDLVAISVLRFGAGVWQLMPRRWPSRLFVLASVLGVLEAVALPGMVIRRGDFDAVLHALPQGRNPILSETPWIPLLAGERPFVLDAYNLAIARRSSKDIYPHLVDAVDGCRFRVVVLNGTAESSEYWYGHEAFGAPFREHLLASYAFDRTVGGHAIYLPNCGKPRPAPNELAVRGGEDTVLQRGGEPNRLRVLLNRILSFKSLSGRARGSAADTAEKPVQPDITGW
jgi:hypothetical protein